MRRRRWIGALVLVAAMALVFSWGTIDRHVRAARLLIGFQNVDTPVDGGIEARPIELAGLRAIRYAGPLGGPPVMLVHGVHAGGIDEPRLVHFARLLTAAGFTVTTPEIAAMTELVLDPRSAVEVGEAADAFARAENAPSVALVGISFGGGLALIAAAERPETIHAVWAIGAPDDLPRLVTWWVGDDAIGPAGERAHDHPESYGAQVLAYSFSEDFFAADDLEAGRAILGAYLRGELARSSALRRDASPTLEASLLAATHPGARIRALAERHRDVLVELSPGPQMSSVRSHVYLLHGIGDPVVASTESLYLARDLGDPEDVLLTGLLGHADATEDPSLTDQWLLVHHAAAALDGLSP